MKIATLYQATLKDDQLYYDWTAGDHQLSVEFRWPIVEQELWDTFVLRVTDMASGDPIIEENGTFNRSYDYIDYYTETVPQDITEREVWWNEQTSIPASLKGKTYEQVSGILQDRVVLATGMAEYRQELSEALHYQGIITDENSETVIVDVLPGGWFHNQDDNWAIRFVADTNAIAKDRLGNVTVEVESYAIE